MTTVAAHRAVVDGRLIGPVRIQTDDDRIVAIEETAARPGDVDVGDHLLAPGFIDLHCHGGDGGSFNAADPEAAQLAASYHQRHGTTSQMASLGSAPLDDLAQAATCLAELTESGVFVGIHFEGPFLSEARAGAHRREYLVDPAPSAVDRLVEAAHGHARIMTLAPERTGGMAAISQLRSSGVIAALGHSDASYEQAVEALDRGVTLATHLWNGMRGLHHRVPGPIPALIGSDEVVCELIVDGEHLHPAIVEGTYELLGARRIALITDAILATGLPDGTYDFSDQPVVVRRGRAELADGSSLAGSTLTLDAALRNAVGAGVPLVDAIESVTATPARVLQLDDRGVLQVGNRADLVVLDAGLEVAGVMRGGTWLVAPAS